MLYENVSQCSSFIRSVYTILLHVRISKTYETHSFNRQKKTRLYEHKRPWLVRRGVIRGVWLTYTAQRVWNPIEITVFVSPCVWDTRKFEVVNRNVLARASLRFCKAWEKIIFYFAVLFSIHNLEIDA